MHNSKSKQEYVKEIHTLMKAIDELHNNIPRTWTKAVIYFRSMKEDNNPKKTYEEIVESINYIKDSMRILLGEVKE